MENVWEGWPVKHYHRPLSTYLNCFAGEGLLLQAMHRPSVYEPEKIPDIPLYVFCERLKI